MEINRVCLRILKFVSFDIRFDSIPAKLIPYIYAWTNLVK